MLNRLIRVNAKYKSQGTNSSFQMNFETLDVRNVMGISIQDATLTRLFPNIYAPISTFRISWLDVSSNPTTFSVIVPSGQYEAKDLAPVLQTAIQAVDAHFAGVTVTYDVTAHRFVFNWNGSGGATAVRIETTGSDPLSELAPYIGVTINPAAPTTGYLLTVGPFAMPSPPSLEGPTSVYLQSRFVATSYCVDVKANNSYVPYMASIDFTKTPYGFASRYQSSQNDYSRIDFRREGGRNLNNFDVQVTDQFGNFLELPENCYLDMHMLVFYMG